jgi:Protein of unknown function (DUF1592)/Protein of unknown function (DUF1588)/Protein of unknown function (DUF1595)/Protein of unknown function (DUF1587)
MPKPRAKHAWPLLTTALALGCGRGTISPPYPGSAAPTGAVSAAGSGGAGATTHTVAGTPGASPMSSAGSAAAPVDTGNLPARIRRLTNAEFDTSVKALLNIDSTFGASFTPDTRQDGFTRSDAQRVDPVFMTQLDAAAKQLAQQAIAQLNNLAPCSNVTDAAASETCARTFLTSFATRAYRRPATAREVAALVTVYQAGADGAAYSDGIQLALQAVLEAPGFLYTTELGPTPLAPSAQLTDYELATSLAFLLTGAPPDDALLQAAAAGQLQQADARKVQAQRLLASDAAGKQITRMVEEWLGIDRITETAKDSTVYPDFAGLRDAMKHEADAFVSEVMWKDAGSVSDLLSADWTPAEDGLARMYLGADQQPTRDNGHVSLTGVRRRGILTQGAFLSVYAHAQETAPVLRGVAVLRRIACFNVPAPSTLNINIVPPVADPNKTTRERFEIHAQDPVCAGCHNQIDSLGFTFEGLDGMGKARTTENNKPIDSATQVAGNFSFDGNYTDAAALALQLASSSELQLLRHPLVS